MTSFVGLRLIKLKSNQNILPNIRGNIVSFNLYFISNKMKTFELQL